MTNGRNFKFFALILVSAILIAIFVPAASAFRVGIAPLRPQLGDTIVVAIEPDGTPAQSPTVTMNQRQYTAFLIAPNRWRALLPTTPLDKPGIKQIEIYSNGNGQKFNVQLQNRNFPTQNIWFDENTASLEPTDYELKRVAQFKQIVTPQKFWQGAFLRPNEGPITTGFGVRRYYNGVFADDYYHRGVDYAGNTGSAVVAPAAGQIRLVGRVSQGFRIHGNMVGIDHGQGVASIFMHLSRIDVKEGDFVRAGQVIGGVGSTGAATGPHLHWGLYVNGESVDPVPWCDRGFE